MVLIALEKILMLSQGRGLCIPCVAALARPREGADIVDHKGADIGILFRSFSNPVYI